MRWIAGRTFGGFSVFLILGVSPMALGQSSSSVSPTSASMQAPLTGASAAVAATPASGSLESGVFVRVNAKRVTHAEFHAAFGAYLRQKYYHGKVPDDELFQARKVVTDQIVNYILLSEEAVRRGVELNRDEVDRRIKNVEQQNANSLEWQRDREGVLPQMRSNFEDQDRIARLEARIRDGASVSAEQVRAFYQAKPELFTEPERLRVHVILLGVDPSSSVSVWNAAIVEAESIVKRLRGGADFADIARLVSADPSAAKGGDMGYVHVGMLPEGVQAALATYKPGVVGDPIRVLEGVGVFRVDEHITARLRDYDDVKERAQQLALREKRDQVWTDFMASIRNKADVVFADVGSVPMKAPSQ
jgi:parvulin-like peptidyl-prolyl isomerase